MTTPTGPLRVTVQPDEDGVCEVVHGLRSETIQVVVAECPADPTAQVTMIMPISKRLVEFVVNTVEPVTVIVSLPEKATEEDPAEATRRRRYGT